MNYSDSLEYVTKRLDRMFDIGIPGSEWIGPLPGLDEKRQAICDARLDALVILLHLLLFDDHLPEGYDHFGIWIRSKWPTVRSLLDPSGKTDVLQGIESEF